MLKYITAFTIEALLSLFLTACTVNLLKQCRLRTVNYRNIEMPYPIGIAYIPVLAASQFIYMIFFKGQYFYDYVFFSFAAITVAFGGLLDDLAGQKEIKGFRQHFAALFSGRVTTGILKAFLGFLMAVLSSVFISGSITELLVNMFTVLFFINLQNLLDVRPGRCIKVFILLSLVLFPFSLNTFLLNIHFYFVFISTVIIFFYDVRERGMLGDTGANLLGLVLGYYCIRLLPTTYKIVIMLILALINLISEKVSLSAVIERNRLLRYFDYLGRKGERD